jgi:hypothetical protein
LLSLHFKRDKENNAEKYEKEVRAQASNNLHFLPPLSICADIPPITPLSSPDVWAHSSALLISDRFAAPCWK